jgi:hypothetical protein
MVGSKQCRHQLCQGAVNHIRLYPTSSGLMVSAHPMNAASICEGSTETDKAPMAASYDATSNTSTSSRGWIRWDSDVLAKNASRCGAVARSWFHPSPANSLGRCRGSPISLQVGGLWRQQEKKHRRCARFRPPMPSRSGKFASNREAAGVTDDKLSRLQIGIAHCWIDTMPCSLTHRGTSRPASPRV